MACGRVTQCQSRPRPARQCRAPHADGHERVARALLRAGRSAALRRRGERAAPRCVVRPEPGPAGRRGGDADLAGARDGTGEVRVARGRLRGRRVRAGARGSAEEADRRACRAAATRASRSGPCAVASTRAIWRADSARGKEESTRPAGRQGSARRRTIDLLPVPGVLDVGERVVVGLL